MRTVVLMGICLTIVSGQTKHIWDRSSPLPYGFNVGEVFPTRALRSVVDGKPVSLAQLRGKKTIVNIFAPW